MDDDDDGDRRSGSRARDGPGFQSALLAGALAGTSVDVLLFPLDTVKTRLQAAGGFFAAGGFGGIYRGLGSVLVGSAPGAASFFCTYEAAKAALAPEAAGPGAHLLAASLGEVAACAVRVPTEVVKQRAQAGHHGGSSAAALAAILARGPTHGWASVWLDLYRGWSITLLRELPFTAIQFPLWEAMKAWRCRRPGPASGSPNRQTVSAPESALFGSMAGAVAAAITTPLDVLKTRVMLSHQRPSLAAIVRHMARHEGPRAFFAGIVPRVTWISLGGAIFLGSYQWAINTINGLAA